jgi:AcrR family transcriptional regulator
MTTTVGLRERKKARTREALQEAAMELFTRQGFDGTTVEEIADACEVSPRTFFRYFPTKEDVLFADTEARRERLLTVLADRPAGEPPFAALHAAMRALAFDYRDDRVALVARSKVLEGSPQLQAYKAEHQHGWEAAVVDALERRPAVVGAPLTRE